MYGMRGWLTLLFCFLLVNIAAGRSATQSTTAYDGFPAHALDGNLDSHYNRLSCTHTAEQNYPWWRVDLGSSQHVSEVFIVNRVGCCMDRLRNIAIYVGKLNVHVE